MGLFMRAIHESPLQWELTHFLRIICRGTLCDPAIVRFLPVSYKGNDIGWQTVEDTCPYGLEYKKYLSSV